MAVPHMGTKLVVCVALFIVAFTCGVAPKTVIKLGGQAGTEILSMATVFGGGVFLGAAFMHLLGEASETMAQQKVDFPLAELLVCVGFLTIFAFEEICVGASSCFQENNDSISYAKLEKQNSVDEMQVMMLEFPETQESLHQQLVDVVENAPTDGSDSAQLPATRRNVKAESFEAPRSPANGGHSHGHSHGAIQNGDAELQARLTGQMSTGTWKCRIRILLTKLFLVSGYMLVGALSFHSIFDGLAIGTTTSSGQLTAVSIAVFAHKPIAAFALGSMLSKARCAQELNRLMCIFAVTSPIGVLFGLGLLYLYDDGESSKLEMISAVCQSFAAGTFVYVATIEVFSKEFFGNPIQKRCKFLCASLGLLAMALLKLLEPGGD